MKQQKIFLRWGEKQNNKLRRYYKSNEEINRANLIMIRWNHSKCTKMMNQSENNAKSDSNAIEMKLKINVSMQILPVISAR